MGVHVPLRRGRAITIRAQELASTGGAKDGSSASMVYALILANIAIFIGDKILRVPLFHRFYLYHSHWMWWQPLSTCFCHASRQHLSGNMFLLLLFGRSVEDDLGWIGLLFAYSFCGILANLVSLVMLPAATVSLGASGAVFGLFAVSICSRLAWRDLDWRKLCEVLVLGEFVVGRVISEARTAAAGGVAGVNHVAHLAGAGAGVAMVLLLRGVVNKMERIDERRRGGVAGRD